jgi:hypothetical protein
VRFEAAPPPKNCDECQPMRHCEFHWLQMSTKQRGDWFNIIGMRKRGEPTEAAEPKPATRFVCRKHYAPVNSRGVGCSECDAAKRRHNNERHDQNA